MRKSKHGHTAPLSGNMAAAAPGKVSGRHKNRFFSSVVKYSAAILIAAYLCLCVSMRLTVRDTSYPEGDCMLYYMVNVDGMKGLGHSILLLVDEEGCGTVFSFNGMQRSLGECLLGKSGIGKLSTGTMTAEEATAFLQSGNLHLDGDQLTDHYDVALYRPITSEDQKAVLEQAALYLAAEEAFTALYQKWAEENDAVRKEEFAQALEQMGEDKSLPLYQIYTHNCDHAAREMAAAVDQDLREYTDYAWRMTPNGNLKAFAGKGKKWGVMTMGEQTLREKVFLFLMSF